MLEKPPTSNRMLALPFAIPCGLIVGFAVGGVMGLSASPIAQSVVGALVAVLLTFGLGRASTKQAAAKKIIDKHQKATKADEGKVSKTNESAQAHTQPEKVSKTGDNVDADAQPINDEALVLAGTLVLYASFSAGMVLAMPFALYARTHDMLSPSPADEIKVWTAAGYDDATAHRVVLISRNIGISAYPNSEGPVASSAATRIPALLTSTSASPAESAPPTKPKPENTAETRASTKQTVLFEAGKEKCAVLTRHATSENDQGVVDAFCKVEQVPPCSEPQFRAVPVKAKATYLRSWVEVACAGN